MTVTSVRAAGTTTASSAGSVSTPKSFRSIQAFESFVGKNGTFALKPGASVKVFVGPVVMGMAHPTFEGVNKNSPFKVEWDGTNYILSAKPDAKGGATDAVKLSHGSAPILNAPPAVKFPFKLQVAEAGAQVTAADNGKTIKVKLGEPVKLSLPANGTTGYQWKVVTTDRTFGYPTEKYVQNSPTTVGGGGVSEFEWQTKGPFSTAGKHKVTLEYARPFGSGRPAQTFSFTVDVK